MIYGSTTGVHAQAQPTEGAEEQSSLHADAASPAQGRWPDPSIWSRPSFSVRQTHVVLFITQYVRWAWQGARHARALVATFQAIAEKPVIALDIAGAGDAEIVVFIATLPWSAR